MIEPATILQSFSHIPADIESLASLFASDKGVGRRYVLGRNEHSAALSELFEIDCFVDDFAEPGTIWNGRPVVKREMVPKNAVIVSCSMSISPVSVAKMLARLDVFGVLNYMDLHRVFPQRVPLPIFVAETRLDVERNWKHWTALYEVLADAASKQVFDDLLAFRLTGDLESMAAYTVRLQDQYFEDFLGLGAGEVFVDAGGYDGDTAEEFCLRVPDYKKIFFFEPSPENIKKAKIKLKDRREIDFIERGLSNVEESVWFNPDAGSASAISTSGSLQIKMTTMDLQVQERVTFIKMDLEGGEYKALEGAKRHILEDHPKLAIAVYHQSADFWQLFEQILRIRSDYRVYLRHYTEGWSETVMFFVPVAT
jgi:FkbM family methyltransferase